MNKDGKEFYQWRKKVLPSWFLCLRHDIRSYFNWKLKSAFFGIMKKVSVCETPYIETFEFLIIVTQFIVYTKIKSKQQSKLMEIDLSYLSLHTFKENTYCGRLYFCLEHLWFTYETMRKRRSIIHFIFLTANFLLQVEWNCPTRCLEYTFNCVSFIAIQTHSELEWIFLT